MFAVLHGTLAPHPWRDPESAEADAYSLFHARSLAMRLLTAAVEGASGGVWGMNDAGADSPVDSDSSRIGWFQVGVTDDAERSLPVQAVGRRGPPTHAGSRTPIRVCGPRCEQRSTSGGLSRRSRLWQQTSPRGFRKQRSLDAIGWLVGFLADVVSQQGVSGDVMFTVSRNGLISTQI